ncbi:MAG: shikimate dehydrogenase [Candidatus Gracilibacteria bacterium]|jgi:shikimate dehydrogenase
MIKKYGILANPAKHSLSPVMHNAAFNECGIEAEYFIYEIPEMEFPAFMKQAKNEHISGLSVSLPYKETIMNFLHVIDEDAKKIGAVNTVLNDGGYLYGYNTDFIGSNLAIKEICGDNLKEFNVVVLGAGGSARAVIYGLLREGVKNISIINRTKENAIEIADDFNKIFNVKIECFDVKKVHEDFNKIGDKNLLIQTTSIWTLNPNISKQAVEDFCPKSFVNNFEYVMDIIYNPIQTPLIKIANELGKKTITGDSMLLYQAAEQFKIWTKKKAPIEVMRKALNDNLI